MILLKKNSYKDELIQIFQIDKYIDNVSEQFKNLKKNKLNNPLSEIYINIKNSLDERKIKLNNLHNYYQILDDFYKIKNKPKEKKTFFTRKCPDTKCCGYLSTRWKCELCNKYVCKDCNEFINENDHKCDPILLETMRVIHQDTKPCPKCGSYIHKISGCDQMFCVKCYTAFSWTTGAIEMNRIHNPHYYELKNKMDLQFVNIDQCENNCGNTRIIRNNMYSQPILKIIRLIEHVRNIDCRRLLNLEEKYNAEREIYRIKYLKKEIDDTKWQCNLYKSYKKYMKNSYLLQIYNTFVNIGTEIINSIDENIDEIICDCGECDDCDCDDCNDNKYSKYEHQCYQLLDITNDALIRIGNLYNNKISIISV